MIDRIDEQGDKTRHADIDKPRCILQFGTPINQVGGKNIVDDALFAGLIHFLKPVCKLGKGGDTEDAACAARTSGDHDAMRRQVGALDVEIDRLVYNLYGLTADEITLVESSFEGA